MEVSILDRPTQHLDQKQWFDLLNKTVFAPRAGNPYCSKQEKCKGTCPYPQPCDSQTLQAPK